MMQEFRARCRRLLANVSPTATEKVASRVRARRGRAVSKRHIARLRARVSRLESEMQETRRLNLRLAELTDIVQELLVPISQRDEDKVRELLKRYSASL